MDYSGLLAQVVDTLGSQVTTTQVNALLPLVEARFNRIIDSPERETESYATPTDDITLPSDCWRLRDIWRVDTPPVTLAQLAPEQARFIYGMQTGSVVAFSLTGRTLDFWPTPGSTSTDEVRIRYQKTIPALSSTQTTNWLLDSHPDIYYYALLLQCEAYIVNDERLGIWKAALDEALAELDVLDAKQRFAQSPISARVYRFDN